VASYTALTYWELAAASVFVFIDAGLSVIFALNVHRGLLVAAIRMVVQLTLVGLVLTTLFSLVSPLWTGIAAFAMVLFAGHEAAQRQERRLAGWWSYGLGTGCMMMSSVLVTVFALLTAVRPNPWYDPRYAIPLLGMILGNCMTGVGLGLNTLTTSLVNRRASVEAQLMLGATRQVAAGACDARGTPQRADAHHQFHGRHRRGFAAGNDDRTDSRWGAPGRGGQIPDPRDVPDCRGYGLGSGNGGARRRLPPHRRASPASSRSADCAEGGLSKQRPARPSSHSRRKEWIGDCQPCEERIT